MQVTVEENRQPRFDTTNWSLVLAAAGRGAPGASDALGDLCSLYWVPVYAFVRRRGYGRQEAEDLTQSFFERLLSTDWLRRADRERGRFRSFLLVSLRHFLSNDRDARHARKRGGDRVHVPLDVETAERHYENDGRAADPETLYVRQWAFSLIEQALREFRERLRREERQEQAALLLPFLTGDAPRGEYAAAAMKLQTTEGAVRVAVHRLRARFRDSLRRIVERTVAEPSEVDKEIRHLIAALSV